MSTGCARFDQARCVQSVRDALANLQDGVPSLSAITRQLGVSERTLRRRLKSVGTSYNEILKEMRATVAMQLLLEKMVTVDRIAVQLGYSESANFRHAFRRWTGHSPQSYRFAARLEQIDPST
jgi:AraC-like DNA-binding protein